MALNPKASAWMPGGRAAAETAGGRIMRVVHGVGTHKSEDRTETLGVGGLSLPVKKDKHRANYTARGFNTE